MNPELDNYLVSSATERVDLDFVCAALAGSYWARHRPRQVIAASLRTSLCFGIYEKAGGGQVGFARVVTDGATFSWVCDLVVDPAHRKKGLGKLLMASVVSHPRLAGTQFLLGTRDAHGLYQKFGFARSEMMRRMPDAERPKPASGPRSAASSSSGEAFPPTPPIP